MQDQAGRDKPKIFLGSSGKQTKLVETLTNGLADIAHVEPWTTTFSPGTTTIERLLELTHEVDFAAFIFARDDWTSTALSSEAAGQASPRDNVVFEAGLFGGVLGMRRTFILHAQGAKLPTDLLGLTSIRYNDDSDAEIKRINENLRQAILNTGRIDNIEGIWWQFSLTERSVNEPSAVSILSIKRDRAGALEVRGRAWQENGTLSARYWSEATKESISPSGIFYYFKGERPKSPNAPYIEGTGEIKLENANRASGNWTTHSAIDLTLNTRTAGVYLRADANDLIILDGNDNQKRVNLIAERLANWKEIAST